MKFKPLATPLLIVGDNPALPGGLSRICRDLATLCCTLPQFRVGVLGRGIGARNAFPFVLYDYPEYGQWGEDFIRPVWNDFSGGEDGIILTTDDPSRRHWFANPVGLPSHLQEFLGPGRNFEKWGYFPIDSTGPNQQTLPHAGRDCVAHYDRVLTASDWGCNVVMKGGTDANWLPHGYFGDKFKLNLEAKAQVGWEDRVVVGSVMANQQRKDFPVLFESFALLRREYGNKFLGWLNTDTLTRHWNVAALAADYGVGDCIEVTLDLSDEQLSMRYAACDCTLLPSAGEGFGYPIIESLACGTACIVTNYAAGPCLVDNKHTAHPIAFRIDTPHNVQRAVLSAHNFVNAAVEQVAKKRDDWEYRSGQLAETVSHLEWSKLRGLWERWLKGGLK